MSKPVQPEDRERHRTGRWRVPLLVVVLGASVAGIYYAWPPLPAISCGLGVSKSRTALLDTAARIDYAAFLEKTTPRPCEADCTPASTYYWRGLI